MVPTVAGVIQAQAGVSQVRALDPMAAAVVDPTVGVVAAEDRTVVAVVEVLPAEGIHPAVAAAMAAAPIHRVTEDKK